LLPLVAVVVLVIIAAVIGTPYLTPGPERTIAWTAAVVALALAAWRLRPTSRRRRRP
jgi:putative Ca2+/H+ antiporter (TMEM165/GDT1 family)